MNRPIVFVVEKPEKAPRVGDALSVPIDDGADWFELGTVTSARLTDGGRVVCILRPGDGVEFPESDE